MALQELKEDSDSGRLQAAPAGAKKTSLLRLVVVTVVVVAFAVAGWSWLGRRHGAEPEVPLTAVPLTSYPGMESSPSCSPDGTQMAFSWTGEKEGNSDIYIKLIGAEPPMRLTTDPANEDFPAWSPDGRWIAFLRQLSKGKFTVVLMPPIPGSERVLTEAYISERGSCQRE